MLTAIGDVMRRCYEKGWITTRDGNISLRKKDSMSLYITPSGGRKTIIHPEHVVKLKIVEEMGEAGLIVPDGANPSGELHMHWLIQQEARSTRAVVHVHPTHVVAAMYRGLDLQRLCKDFPEIYRYTRVGPTVPALPAISRELGDATAAALAVNVSGELKYDIVGQKITAYVR
jgi:L-fuculose-phosphate aldolase